MFTATRKPASNGIPWFSFAKAQRRVTCVYFYMWDEDFGPAFIKVCAYSPYPVKIWLNGREWAKRQATKQRLAFRELSNGFASCEDPAALQAICDRLGPGTINVFCERWWSRLPLPLIAAERAGGYWWEVSMRQIEASRIFATSHATAMRLVRGHSYVRHHEPFAGASRESQTSSSRSLLTVEIQGVASW